MLTDDELAALAHRITALVGRYDGDLKGTQMTVRPGTLAALVDEVERSRRATAEADQ